MKKQNSIFIWMMMVISCQIYGQTVIATDTVTIPVNTRCQLATKAWGYVDVTTGALEITWDPNKLEWIAIDFQSTSLLSHSMVADTQNILNGSIMVCLMAMISSYF